ncbi:hypothetical protein A3746_05345 [Oleibacter sp. HI0075]|nr:hypothetical protein A3746_05345 [Oleibacter sp. HI0075]|tara:strand:- start:3364 stop:4398 length:1035 start_codon:yes stop_codon:yes gene_type:complete
MAKHLFLASTPFNVLTAAMIAFELLDGDHAELGLIDQTETTATFRNAVLHWTDSPFSMVHQLSQQAKGKHKRAQRKQAFQNIAKCLKQLNPDWIYTGNDRRIEFQYAMAHSSARGVYVDDGTYSYLGRPTHWFKDQVVDNLVKKVAYGRWWKQPPAIGASEWIDHSVLAFPNSAIDILKRRPCKQLPSNLGRSEFSSLAHLCLQTGTGPLSDLKGLLLLPHESAITDSQTLMGNWLSNCAKPAGYKHHPRTSDASRSHEALTTRWNLPADAVSVEPSIPMEILLPLLSADCKIAGDASTALLTAKWLRPELNVSAFITADTSSDWTDLLKRLNINISLSEPAGS